MVIGAFPIDSDLISKLDYVYNAGKSFVILGIPALVMGRAVINMIYLKNSEDYFEIIKDLILAVILLSSFMYFIKGVLCLPDFYGSLLKDYATLEMNIELEEDSWAKAFSNPLYLFIIGCYYVCYVLYIVILSITCAFGSFIIIAGTLFRSYWILRATFWMIVILGSWPLIWYMINFFIQVLDTQGFSIVTLFLSAIFSVVKIILPIFALIKTLNAGPLQAGTSAVSFAAKSALGVNSKIQQSKELINSVKSFSTRNSDNKNNTNYRSNNMNPANKQRTASGRKSQESSQSFSSSSHKKFNSNNQNPKNETSKYRETSSLNNSSSQDIREANQIRSQNTHFVQGKQKSENNAKPAHQLNTKVDQKGSLGGSLILKQHQNSTQENTLKNEIINYKKSKVLDEKTDKKPKIHLKAKPLRNDKGLQP